MSDLNGALGSVYNHLNTFEKMVNDLRQDNAMLKGMQEHALDQKSVDLAVKIQAQVNNLQTMQRNPSVGAQQVVSNKLDKELKDIKEKIELILKSRLDQRGGKAVEKPYKPKT